VDDRGFFFSEWRINASTFATPCTPTVNIVDGSPLSTIFLWN
jgi:hypothetical protein